MKEFEPMKRGDWGFPSMNKKPLTIDEPFATGTEALVCQDIAERQRKGIAKYGTTVCANPLELREWLQHAYEECLDQAVSLRRAIQELDK